MIPPSVSFFLRLLAILYIIVTWFDIATKYISDSVLLQANKPISSFNMTELDPQNQRNKTQTCHQKCSQFYQKVSIDHTPLEWLYCQNNEKSNILVNNQTYLDLLNRLSKQANDCQQYNRITQLSNFTNGIRLRHDGCYLNHSHNIYQCYDVMISQKHFRMTKSTIKPSIFSKMKIISNQYFLDAIFTPQTREKIYQVLQIISISKDSSLIFLVLLFIYIYFYDELVAAKDSKVIKKLLEILKVQKSEVNKQLEHTKIQYGFKLIEFTEQKFQKKTNGKNSSLNFKIVQNIRKIIKFLWNSQHKKIKLMTFPSGMGVSRSIQSQIRNNRMYYFKYAVLFDLKDSYSQVSSKNQQTNPIDLLDSLLYALQHEDQRIMKNIILTHLNGLYLYCKDWLMGILNIEVKYLVIIFINTLLIENQYEKLIIVWIIQVLAFMYYFWQEAYSFIIIMYLKFQYQRIIFLQRKKKGTKKAILINHFQLIKYKKQGGEQDDQKKRLDQSNIEYQKRIEQINQKKKKKQKHKQKIKQLMQTCLKIQKRQKYDIILISHKIQFTAQIKSYYQDPSNEQEQRNNLDPSPFKQMPECPHRLSNDQVLIIIQSRVEKKYVKIAQLVCLFTQDVEVIMNTFRTVQMDRKYQTKEKQMTVDQKVRAIQTIFKDMKNHLNLTKKRVNKIIDNYINKKILQTILVSIIQNIESKNKPKKEQTQFEKIMKAFWQQIIVKKEIQSSIDQSKKFRLFLSKLFLSIDDAFDYSTTIKKAVKDKMQIQQINKGLKYLTNKGILAKNNFSSITFAIVIYQKYNNINNIELSDNFQQRLLKQLEDNGNKNNQVSIMKYYSLFLYVATIGFVLLAVFIYFKSEIKNILQK